MQRTAPGAPPPLLRRSTPEDVQGIHAWLRRQEASGVHGTFLCNWELTRKQHEAGELLVCVDSATGEAIAYQWGGLIHPGILEVREDWRGRGIGKLMVDHLLDAAYQAGEDLLRIQCKPSSSVPFWKRMGFEMLDNERGKTYGVRVIHRNLDLPDDGEPVQMTIEWFPETRKWHPETAALATHSPKAVRTSDGDVFLAERVHWFSTLPGLDRQGGVVLRIVVDGREIYCDKARYPDAEDLGLKQCRNGYFLDCILAPD